MYGDPKYALFGGINDRPLNTWASAGDLISTADTAQYALNRASFGDRHQRDYRWIEIYEVQTGACVLRWDDREGARPHVAPT